MLPCCSAGRRISLPSLLLPRCGTYNSNTLIKLQSPVTHPSDSANTGILCLKASLRAFPDSRNLGQIMAQCCFPLNVANHKYHIPKWESCYKLLYWRIQSASKLKRFMNTCSLISSSHGKPESGAATSTSSL